jgi:hypothetical protein
MLLLVVVARWALATQGQASLVTGRCRVLVALQLLVVRQQQQDSQVTFEAVVQAPHCPVQDFKVDAAAAQLLWTPKVAVAAAADCSAAVAVATSEVA